MYHLLHLHKAIVMGEPGQPAAASKILVEIDTYA